MDAIIYCDYHSKQPSFIKVDGDSVVDFNTHTLRALVEKNIWYSYNTREPIAFEEDKIVFDYSSHNPILFREDA